MRYKKMWLKLKSDLEDRERIYDDYLRNPYNVYGELMYWTGKKETIGTLKIVVKQIETEEEMRQ